MTVARYNLTAVDSAGNILPGASVEVRSEGPGTPLASLFTDRAGLTPAGNPLTADGTGDGGFYCAAGYYKITVTSGLFSKIWRYVAIGLLQGFDSLAFSDLTGNIAVSQINGGTSASASTYLRGDGTWASLPSVDAIFVPPQGRLTLSTGVAVMTSTVSAATIIYYTPSMGNLVPLYDGTSYIPTPFFETPHSTTDATKSPAACTTNSNYDLFAWKETATVTVTIASPGVFTWTSHGMIAGMPISFTTSGALPTGLTANTKYYVIAAGLTANAFEVSTTAGGSAVNTSGSQSGTHTATVTRLSRGPLWTSNTARGTGAGTTELELVKGIYLNKVSITNGPAANRGTYLGTIRTNGSSQVDYSVGGSASGGTAGSLGVWNMYNRNLAVAKSTDSGTSYTYTSNTIRQARASAGNQISFIVGLIVDAIQITYQSRLATVATAANAFGQIGIGEDVTNASTSPRVYQQTVSATVSAFGTPTATLAKFPLLGYHTYAAVEASDAVPNANTFNAESTATITAKIWN